LLFPCTLVFIPRRLKLFPPFSPCQFLRMISTAPIPQSPTPKHSILGTQGPLPALNSYPHPLLLLLSSPPMSTIHPVVLASSCGFKSALICKYCLLTRSSNSSAHMTLICRFQNPELWLNLGRQWIFFARPGILGSSTLAIPSELTAFVNSVKVLE